MSAKPPIQIITRTQLSSGTRSHHSNFDTYERIVPADMMKNATIIAAFAYHTAMRDEPLPRKPLPEPSRMPF